MAKRPLTIIIGSGQSPEGYEKSFSSWTGSSNQAVIHSPAIWFSPLFQESTISLLKILVHRSLVLYFSVTLSLKLVSCSGSHSCDSALCTVAQCLIGHTATSKPCPDARFLLLGSGLVYPSAMAATKHSPTCPIARGEIPARLCQHPIKVLICCFLPALSIKAREGARSWEETFCEGA